MFEQFKSLRLLQKLIFLIVPTIALVIVIRQHYLHQTQNLSIWKGGGMGMFAASDVVTRMVKIYIQSPQGEIHPVINLTPVLDRLRRKILFNPSDTNFRELANMLGKFKYVSGNEKFPHRVIDKNGKEVSRKEGKYFYLRAAGLRTQGDKPEWKVLIEFWDTRYDSNTRFAKPILIKRKTYSPD